MQFRLACTKIPKDVLLLEIGPHALMRSPLRQNRSDLQYVATMKKGENAVETLKAAVADLWRKGAIFSWPASAAPSAGAHPEREPLASAASTTPRRQFSQEFCSLSIFWGDSNEGIRKTARKSSAVAGDAGRLSMCEVHRLAAGPL